MAALANGYGPMSLALASLLIVSTATALQFRVGGLRGWREPAGNETETYNQWAMRNRFHVGDYLYFKYENDSVLVVDREDYSYCNTSKPFFTFDNGNTMFRFDRYGFFYFISGEPGHCKSGQRLIIRVMVHPELLAPGPAPASQQGGSEGGGSGHGSGSSTSGKGKSSASLKLSAGSSMVMAALGFILVVLLYV